MINNSNPNKSKEVVKRGTKGRIRVKAVARSRIKRSQLPTRSISKQLQHTGASIVFSILRRTCQMTAFSANTTASSVTSPTLTNASREQRCLVCTSSYSQQGTLRMPKSAWTLASAAITSMQLSAFIHVAHSNPTSKSYLRDAQMALYCHLSSVKRCSKST